MIGCTAFRVIVALLELQRRDQPSESRDRAPGRLAAREPQHVSTLSAVQVRRRQQHCSSRTGCLRTDAFVEGKGRTLSMGFQPSTVATDGEAANPGPRLRRRGPRSIEARERRRDRNFDRSQPLQIPDTSDVLVAQQFRILHVNIRGWASNSAELTARIRFMPARPDLICVNETFLDRTTEHVWIEGYSLIARRDRDDGRKCGGIAAFALSNIAERVTLVQSSEDAERVWLMVHADHGPHLVGVWYRPPIPGETSTIETFQTELQGMAGMSMGRIILGDLNVHNVSWLRHSSRSSAEGTALRNVCDEAGLEQKVQKPTRDDNLLDLVLTDIPGTKAKTLPAIADHKLVIAEVDFKVPEQAVVTRTVWQYAKADWERMRSILEEIDWGHMYEQTPHEAADHLTKTIASVAEQCIPQRQLRERKSTHPWLTDETEQLVEAKRAAEGTSDERKAAEACSAGMLAGFLAYTRNCLDKLRKNVAGKQGVVVQDEAIHGREAEGVQYPSIEDGRRAVDYRAATEGEHLLEEVLGKVPVDPERRQQIQRDPNVRAPTAV